MGNLLNNDEHNLKNEKIRQAFLGQFDEDGDGKLAGEKELNNMRKSAKDAGITSINIEETAQLVNQNSGLPLAVPNQAKVSGKK